MALGTAKFGRRISTATGAERSTAVECVGVKGAVLFEIAGVACLM